MGGRLGAGAPQIILVCDAPPNLSSSISFRKLKIKECLFSMTDEMEDPEEEITEVAQKRKRTTKDKRMTASREKKKKEQNFLLFRYLLLLYNLQHFPRFLKYFQNILSKFNSIFICQIHNINSPLFVDTSNSTRTS